MTSTVRTLLVFLAAFTAALAAAPPVDLPGWASALIAAAAAGFAGLGILPPSWIKTSDSRAVKKNSTAERNVAGPPPSHPRTRTRSSRTFMIGLVAALVGLGGFSAASAQAYIHEDAAQNYCRNWNNQSAVDNIRYVEDSMVRPHWTIVNGYYPSTRYGNNDIRVTIQWHEWLEAWQGRLAIDYACRVQGTDDAHMTIVSIAGSAVYWI